MPSERNISTLRRSSSKASRSSKPAVAQLPHRRLLEVAGQLVVAPRPHDQQVPADLVAPQPRLGEVVHPVRPGGEQHDLQLGVEQVEQRLHLLDDRVVAARVEERVASRGAAPRGSAGGSTASESTPSMSTTTAAPGLDRPVAPGPVLGEYAHAVGAQSSSSAAAAR